MKRITIIIILLALLLVAAMPALAQDTLALGYWYKLWSMVCEDATVPRAALVRSNHANIAGGGMIMHHECWNMNTSYVYTKIWYQDCYGERSREIQFMKDGNPAVRLSCWVWVP